MDITGKTALITGGALRIGRALTLALAQAGCHIILHYHRSEEEAQKTARDAEAFGVRVWLRQADLGRLDDPMSLFTELPPGFSPVQILINNAAIFPKDTLLDFSMEDWQRVMRINLRSPVLLTQAFARTLPEDKMGVVINMTDWRTERPYKTHFIYTLSKGALDTFTRAAALQLAPRVRVNGIALGAMLPPEGASASYWQSVLATVPLKQGGGAESAADTLLYLLRNDFITGETIRLTGGAHLRM